MSDKEMKAINKQIDNMVRAGMAEGIGQENYDIVKDIHSVKGKPGKNVPGGLILSKRVSLKAGGLKEATERLRAQGLKKGGKKKKFPDLSGDGKVTMKDILMGRGIIKKTKKKTKKSKS